MCFDFQINSSVFFFLKPGAMYVYLKYEFSLRSPFEGYIVIYAYSCMFLYSVLLRKTEYIEIVIERKGIING